MQITWKELDRLELAGEYVYRIYDSVGNVAYVGCSQNVAKRLAEHAAKLSPVGEYIVRHRPESMEWKIEIVSGTKETEREQIALHNPPFNKVLRKEGSQAKDLILTPPADPAWQDKLRAEFVEAAVDDYIERIVVRHLLGFVLGTTLHRRRRAWFDACYGEYSLREEWAKLFAVLLSGGDDWALAAGRVAYDHALASLQSDIEVVREFCKTVPTPEPDGFGKLPLLDRGKTVNARDVARQMGIWPAEFKANEDRGLPMPLDEWKGFPMSQWRPDLGFDQPR